MQDDKDFLQRLAQGIAALFGESCEVAIHDIRRPEDSTIVAIENGHVSGRKVGGGASEAVLRAREDKSAEDRYNYRTRTPDGRILKSSTIHIRDEGGEITGLIGINYDVSGMMMINSSLEKFLATAEDGAVVDIVPRNVSDLLEDMIEESQRLVGKPVSLMSKEDKIRAIQYLDGRGALLIKKSGDRIARVFDISKYTLYSYLDAELND